MLVEVFSDVACPWCYLGKRRLEAAAQMVDFDVEVRWRAFELDPRAPTEPQDLRALLSRKYGHPRAFEAMAERLSPLGEADGIEFRWDRVKRVNTFNAHRLLHWAGDEHGWEGQGRLKEALMRAYFTEGINVSDPVELEALAALAGLDHDAARGVLAGDAYADAVRADEARAREMELTGVPAFVIEGRFVIPGAQEAETMRLALARVHRKMNDQ